jgi:hypothetical protein
MLMLSDGDIPKGKLMELLDGIAILNGRWSMELADGDWPRVGLRMRRRGRVRMRIVFLLMLHVQTAR